MWSCAHRENGAYSANSGRDIALLVLWAKFSIMPMRVFQGLLVFIHVVCVCSNLYSLDPSGSPVANEGFEFSLSVRGSVPYDASLVRVEQEVLTAVQQVVSALMSGRIV